MTALRTTASCGPSKRGTPTRFLSAAACPAASITPTKIPRTIRTRVDDAAVLMASETPGRMLLERGLLVGEGLSPRLDARDVRGRHRARQLGHHHPARRREQLVEEQTGGRLALRDDVRLRGVRARAA